MKPATHTGLNTPQIGWGQVRHTRLRPTRHAFAYPTAFLMLPMRSLAMARLADSPGSQTPPQNKALASIHLVRHCEAEGRVNLDPAPDPVLNGPEATSSDRSPRYARDDVPRYARDDVPRYARDDVPRCARDDVPQHALDESGFGLNDCRTPSPADTAALAINRRGWVSFHDVDHGDGRSVAAGGALAWMEALLAREGIADADGEIWLQTFPRVLGHTFKPVSFWYAHRTDGTLAAIVAEVNNTFGERHCYLLPAPRYGQVLPSRKVFHVSPFAAVEGGYRFRFMRTQRKGQERLVARVDHDDAQGPLIETSWSGTLEPASAAAVRRMAWRHPLLTLGVVARIHWHALLLWRKKVPFWRKPEPPRDFVTR